MHRSMLAQHGSLNCVSQKRGYEWVARFKSRKRSVYDEARSERPSTSRPQGHIYRVISLIREGRRIIVSEVAEMLNISSGFAYVILHDDLGYRKCVPNGSRDKCLIQTTEYWGGHSVFAALWRTSRFTGQDSHWRRDMRATFWPRKQERKHGVETSWFAIKEEFQQCLLCQKILLTFCWDMKRAILEH